MIWAYLKERKGRCSEISKENVYRRKERKRKTEKGLFECD